jgi:single-strand DNA-binding protein
MLNKVMLIGRLGKDPEIRYAANGTPVVNMRIATDESYVDRDGNRVERTEWHSIVVFQRQAENCKTYLSKGSQIYVEGSLQTRKWQDQQGQERYTTEVKATRVQFLDRKNQGAGAGAPMSSEDGSYGTNGGGDQQQWRTNNRNENLGPAFPSEASGMDDVPF